MCEILWVSDNGCPRGDTKHSRKLKAGRGIDKDRTMVFQSWVSLDPLGNSYALAPRAGATRTAVLWPRLVSRH